MDHSERADQRAIDETSGGPNSFFQRRLPKYHHEKHLERAIQSLIDRRHSEQCSFLRWIAIPTLTPMCGEQEREKVAGMVGYNAIEADARDVTEDVVDPEELEADRIDELFKVCKLEFRSFRILFLCSWTHQSSQKIEVVIQIFVQGQNKLDNFPTHSSRQHKFLEMRMTLSGGDS